MLPDRVKAGYLIDALDGSKPVNITSGSQNSKVGLQKERLENVCFVVADVVSLFPSLKAVEVARLARYCVLLFYNQMYLKTLNMQWLYIT